jgi:hypothetical protein
MKFVRRNQLTPEQKQDLKEDQRKSRSEAAKDRIKENPNYRWEHTENGFVFFKEKWIFIRSRWEANIMAYLEFLKKKGEIIDWEYEPETFWFKNIKRGTNNYKPDFRITRNDRTKYFIEVKGYMTRKDEIKLDRMKRYHPLVEVEVFQKEQYNRIAQFGRMIPGWDQPLKRKKDIS